MISAELHETFEKARAKAQATGKPLVEVLAAEDMLLTPERKREIVKMYLDFLITTLQENEQPERVIRAYAQGRPISATTMYFCLIEWLEDFKGVDLG